MGGGHNMSDSSGGAAREAGAAGVPHAVGRVMFQVHETAVMGPVMGSDVAVMYGT